MKNLFLASLLATAASTVTAELAVGDTICTEGFVMDFFCINRGTLLDNSSVRTLEGPEKHSVHCLIDVFSCVSSPFEILLDPTGDSTLYTRGWQLDDDSKDTAIALAKSVGSCSDCDPNNNRSNSHTRGFRAAMTATITSLNQDSSVPPTISVTEMIDTTAYDPSANGGLSACQTLLGVEDVEDKEETNLEDLVLTGDAAAESGNQLRRLYIIHGTLMLVAWGFLLPTGTLLAKFFKHRPNGLWFKLHRAIQSLGLILALIGWSVALKNFNVFRDVGFNNYRHGICGMVVMILGILQPLNALIRPHAPNDDEEKSTARFLWEIWHKSSGWIAVLLAVPTIILGTLSLPFADDQAKFQIGYGVGCIGGLLLLLAYIFYDKTNYVNEESAPGKKKKKKATRDIDASL